MARLLALLAYPLVLAAGLAGRLLRRDPLRRRRPGPGSLWIERAQPSRGAYFSEASEVEGRGHGGLARPATRALLAFASLLARARPRGGARPAPREGEIPDEIYTLW